MILIVGGGIGGLSLAACLARRGIECELVERERVWTAVGGGITLYPNGMRALRAFGAAAEVEAEGIALDRFFVLDRDGRLLAETPGESWVGVGRTLLINRRGLQRVLVDAAAEVPMRLGVTVAGIEAEGDRAHVSFSDGTGGIYDLVVGADGVRSTVRRLWFGESHPRYVGQMYWRTAVRVNLVDDPTMMFDADRYVVVFPLGDGTTYLAWQVRTPLPLDEVADGTISELVRRFGDFAEPCRAALECVVAGRSVHFGPAEEIDTEQWWSGPVVLIGDAAHACSPTMAQGGSLAIEDAVVLAEVLDRPTNLASALAAFVARRAPRVRWVRDRTHVEIQALNQGAGHLQDRSRTTQEVLAQEI
jgi:2-polyprenyl-6-methoxyphenol hydroxylase-like FAD-dependent oxidoreductase